MPATPANALDITSAGLVKFDGTATFSGVTVTQHDVLVGAASNGITSVAPSATTGVALVSQGAAVDPAFGTVVVAGGGTGLTSITAHDLVVGNGTSALNLIAPSATSGVPLISQGAAADPAFGTAVVAGGGTGAVTLTGVLTGNGTSAITANAVTQHGVLIGGASNAVSSLGVAATGTVLSGVTGADPIFSTNTFVQQVRTDLLTVVTVNSSIPLDNTIPQNTEGVAVTTVTITPTNSNNILVFKGYAWGEHSGGGHSVLSLIQGVTANAIAATTGNYAAANGYATCASLFFSMTAGTTSSTTFTLRAGTDSATWLLNADSGGTRLFGGVGVCYLEVSEYTS